MTKTTELNYIIGLKIKTLRENLGLTRFGFGKIINVDGQALYGYEHNRSKIPANIVFTIAMACDIPILWFYSLNHNDYLMYNKLDADNHNKLLRTLIDKEVKKYVSGMCKTNQ